MESVRDNAVTIVKSANGIGKSFSAAHVATWFYKAFEESQIYTTSAPPLDNLKRILWGELNKIVRNRPGVFMEDKQTRFNISRTESSFITGIAIPTSGSAEQREAKFAGKHSKNIMFIVDEGDAVPYEIYKGIESCMSGGNAKLLVLFNPRAMTGPVYAMEENRRANIVHASAFAHPNVITGRDLIPGAVSREMTVRRINEWTRQLVEGELLDSDVFMLPEYLVGATALAQDSTIYPPLESGYRKIVVPEFAYMVMGQYPTQAESQLISDVWIKAANDRWTEYVKEHGVVMNNPLMGLDVSDFGKDSTIAMFRENNFVGRYEMWSGVDPIVTGDRAAALYEKFHVSLMLVDAIGLGAAVAPYVSRKSPAGKLKAVSVRVSERPLIGYVKSELGEFQLLRDQLLWAVREWLRTEDAMLPPDEYLSQELRTFTYTVQSGKIRVMDTDRVRELIRRSPDRASALALTFSPQRRAKVLSMSTIYDNF